MCRNIKVLRTANHDVSEAEIREAALQYVRKVSGFRQPSQRNQQAFDAAVEAVAEATGRMLRAMTAKVQAGRSL